MFEKNSLKNILLTESVGCLESIFLVGRYLYLFGENRTVNWVENPPITLVRGILQTRQNQMRRAVMRANVKRQIEEYLDLLGKTQNIIFNNIATSSKNRMRMLLTECYEGMSFIRSLIIDNEGENCPLLAVMDEYCSEVALMFEKISQDVWTEKEANHTIIQKLLTEIIHSVQNNIVAKKEVVFLPYKASMWDSLESVWRAASEDPAYDTYVVPIPYYDKNMIGDYATMHYEGDLFPDDVPITDYRFYDFEKRNPDVIFIHNPYDECNYVTSVHPFFYSSNIKKYTEKLVYIPYFVLGEVNPNNSEEVRGMEHFVTLPGIINADYVVVQSENMKKAYVDVITRFLRTSNKKPWEKKILGLGTPKFDKIQSTSRECVTVPENWEKVIYKENGERKKVIMYNNSVSGLLQHSGEMLKKMRELFETFSRYREEIALLWRPHPLIKATIESMRPDLWKAYQQLVEWYQAEGIGIYDDSSDLNRAIALCDAYYGDPSSVVQLCREAGKKIMIQNI